nr:Hydroxyproline O-galactosyltransferase GALT2 [Ipomoea batatas]
MQSFTKSRARFMPEEIRERKRNKNKQSWKQLPSQQQIPNEMQCLNPQNASEQPPRPSPLPCNTELFVLPAIHDCIYCGAKRIQYEPPAFCCCKGEVVLVSNEMPLVLKNLYTGVDDASKNFRTCVRTYNNTFAFTSLGIHQYDKNLFESVARLEENIVKALIEVMSCNPYANFFRSLKDVVHSDDFSILLNSSPSLDQRLYNSPTASQVAAVWIEDYDGVEDNRNIRRKQCFEKVGSDPQYRAENIMHTNFRFENFQGLVDSVGTGAVFGNEVGRRVILPSSFIGGLRDMRGRYMDAMSLVQNFGKHDMFLTMTCNPNWPEIKGLLQYNDDAQNMPDLIARVFHAKMQELKNDITKKQFFGEIAAYTYVIEFQKRGLPHAHFLIILKDNCHAMSPSFVDNFVSAEIPDKHLQHVLYELVKQHMVHGPCGFLNPNCPCMTQRKCKSAPTCKSKYPKLFSDATEFADDSYPIYKRRNTPFLVHVKGFNLDNRWIVPYNPQLLLKFDCHINVEVCASIKSVKYIYKYIYKGHARVSMTLGDNTDDCVIDEIKEYQNARWI